MKPALAHLSPTLPAALATGAAVVLSVFLLSGAEPQGEPAPLLPAIGGAAVHVIADLPATSHHPKAVVRPTSSTSSAELATTPAQGVALHQHRAAVTHAHRPTHLARARVRPAAPPPAQAARPPAPVPVVARHTFQAHPAPKGKAWGHSRSHPNRGAPAAAARPVGNGHGKALGHTHRGTPPGQAKKAPGGPPPTQVAPPKANGGGPPPGHGGGNGNGGKK